MFGQNVHKKEGQKANLIYSVEQKTHCSLQFSVTVVSSEETFAYSHLSVHVLFNTSRVFPTSTGFPPKFSRVSETFGVKVRMMAGVVYMITKFILCKCVLEPIQLQHLCTVSQVFLSATHVLL